MEQSNNRDQIKIVTLCGTFVVATLLFCFFIINLGISKKSKPSFTIEFDYPEHWDKTYVESAKDYEAVFDGEVAENFYTTVDFTADSDTATVSQVFTAEANAMSMEDIKIAQMSENEAWNFVSNGIFTEYPKTSFAQNKDKLIELQKDNTELITVKVWYWSNPDDVTDLTKTTVTKTFAVNSKLANTFRHIFEDIYADPTQPVINIADKGMGTWVLRGKNHKSSNTMSAHALGCAIDINPSTGSFKINGKWYGNGYNHGVMSYNTWSQLPECHNKYHVLYDGCPIVEIFKSYGFYWGGDWDSSKDCMHLAYIGDGGSARKTGINNFKSRQ